MAHPHPHTHQPLSNQVEGGRRRKSRWVQRDAEGHELRAFDRRQELEASLEEFEHPERAVYLLGAEDTGLPESVVRAAHRHLPFLQIIGPGAAAGKGRDHASGAATR